MPDAEVTLPGEASSVPTARRFVESLLGSWGLPDLGWTAAICVSELAGNCALHARTPFTVAVTRLATGAIRIEVSDGSRRRPAMRDYGTDATTGRGLRLLEDLSNGWGVDVRTDGKTVWLVLDPAAPREEEREGEVPEDLDVSALLAAFDDESDSPVSLTTRAWLVAA